MKKTKPIIGIIGGTGKMGQWLTQFFQDNQVPILVADRKTKLTPQELTKKADIIIVSVPISKTQDVLTEIVKNIPPEKLLTDVTSFKVMPMEAMQDAKSGTLGMHPLFGPSATLDQKLKIVFCKQKNNDHVAFLRNLFTTNGIEIIDITPEEHDYQMAYIQAFTYAINLLYAKIIFEQKNVLENKLHTPIFTLQSLIMGRVLDQDMPLISDVQFYNPYFPPVLGAFIEQAKKLETIIEKGERTAFANMFAEEQEIAKNFANFSTLQTNRLLRQVKQVGITIPSKIKPVTLPSSATLAYLGPEGTFSHAAATSISQNNNCKKIPYETIFGIFHAVQNNDVAFGVVPAENSTEGTVRETLDYLIDFSLVSLGSFSLPIHQQLLTHEKKLSDIHTIVSHPQAIAQCKEWISKHLPNAKLQPAASTTEKIANPEKGFAYIGSTLASKKYNIPILVKNIEDNPNNRTKFYLIAKNKIKLTGIDNNKTLIFTTVHNRVGILRDILNVIASDGINLTKLESRPSGDQHGWDYHFFIEFEKSTKNIPVAQTFEKLKPLCPIIRVLGKT